MTATTRRHSGPITATVPGRAPRTPTTGAPRSWEALEGIAYPDLTGDEPCRRPDTDPEVFFPDGTPDADQRTATAKALCGECALRTRQQCLAWALANPARAGEAIWAGLTHQERRTALDRVRAATRTDGQE
ncbi:WhiB family transcriptional regulator [Kitasatospora sp. NPDC058184]|uniref:WhiB family transcriptional regulator n=1 Tax=Kitasatospora sp. NPDC058184 TaxID=3346370 RepID=UPI0036DAE586